MSRLPAPRKRGAAFCLSGFHSKGNSHAKPKPSPVQHNLNEKRAGRGPGRAALGAGAKEPLNQSSSSSSADCRIFCPVRALQKVGNPYRIPPLFELSAEAKSLGIRACRLNQSFPSNSAPPRPASLVPFLPGQERNAPGSWFKICTRPRKPDKHIFLYPRRKLCYNDRQMQRKRGWIWTFRVW